MAEKAAAEHPRHENADAIRVVEDWQPQQEQIAPYELMESGAEQQYMPKQTSLPDLDDESMTFVFNYLEHYQRDLFFSFRSDFCFLFGSFLDLILECYDYLEQEPSHYYTIYLVALLLFLCNSLVDVHWAMHSKQQHGVKKVMKRTFEDATLRPTKLQEQRSDGSDNTMAWWHKVRRHAAHRRTIYAAATFGVAALMAVISVLLECQYSHDGNLDDNDDEESQYVRLFDWASDHMYVVSALIAISGKRTRPWFASNKSCGVLREPESLEDIGDFLFLVGSVLDSVLDDMKNDTRPILGVVSSLLWFVDALFYLRSDFVVAHRVNKQLAADEDDPSAVFV